MILQIINKVDLILNKGVILYKNQAIRSFIQVFVLSFCGWFLYQHLSEIINVTSAIQFRLFHFIIAVLIIMVINIFIGTTSWWCILNGLGVSPSWSRCAYIHVNSTLAKYIPGYVWQYVGKATLSKEIGVTGGVSGIAMAFELGQTLLMGLGIAAIAYSTQGNPNLAAFAKVRPFTFPLGIIVILLSIAIVWLYPFIISHTATNISIRRSYLFASLLLILIGWFLLSLSFWLIATSITSNIRLINFPTFIMMTSVSLTAGILFIFVPNGIGVRESVMVILLKSTMNISLAIVFAALTRLVVTACELFSAFFINMMTRRNEYSKKEYPSEG